MSRFNTSRVAEGLTAYAIERQAGFERHQPPGSQPWMERRRFWTDAILQGMARLEGLTPDPGRMEQYDQRLEEARGRSAVEPAPPDLQRDTIRNLQSFIYALEATGDDRRRQIAAVGDLLEDMACHLPWTVKGNGLDRARDTADQTLVRITAQMPIRFTRILMGGDAGPHWASGFAPGAVTDAGALKQTAVYQEAVRDFPEVKSWPAICTVYLGRGLRFASEAVDATAFDLEIMERAGERFLEQRGVRWTCGFYQMTVSTGPEENQAMETLEPGQEGPAPQMDMTM